MERNIIDLHMHSKHSDDGEFTPEEIVKKAVEAGVKYIAIADHNSVKAVKEAEKYGKEYGIFVVPAIELDCIHKGVNLHVLGYYIDPDFEKFGEIENDILEQEKKVSFERVKLVEKTGIYVNHEKLKSLTSEHGTVTGENIAEASIYEPENQDNELIKPYLEGGDRSDNPYVNFYWDLCAQGKPAYVEVKYISLKEAVDLIKASGGMPILAHPGNNIHENLELLDGIMKQGVLGMEVYSSYHNDEQISFYKNEADKRGCLITCGSDYHGKTKPAIFLGACRCPEAVEKIIIKNFVEAVVR